MKFKRILPLAGVLTLLAGGAAFAQAQQIPAGAAAGAYRSTPGSRAGGAVNPAPPAAQPPAAAATGQAVSKSCSQQADMQGLHGKARKAFRNKCKRSGGR